MNWYQFVSNADFVTLKCHGFMVFLPYVCPLVSNKVTSKQKVLVTKVAPTGSNPVGAAWIFRCLQEETYKGQFSIAKDQFAVPFMTHI